MALKITNTYESGEFQTLFERIDKTVHRVIEVKQSLVTDYPAWPVGTDVRTGLFFRLHNQLNPAMYAALAIHRHMVKPGWWMPVIGKPLDGDSMRVELLNLSQFLKIGLLHQVFSTIEASYRILLRALDPLACDGATAEFKSVYDCLLGAKLALPEDDRAVLDVLRNLRNTVHNGGVVFHRKARDQQVQYRGVLYDFQHQELVQFAAWEPILTWIDDVVSLSNQVMRHPSIAGLPVPVVDPSAMVI